MLGVNAMKKWKLLTPRVFWRGSLWVQKTEGSKRLSHMETQEKGTPHRGTMTLENPEEGAGLTSSGDSQRTRVNRHSVFGSHTFRAQWLVSNLLKSLLLAKYKLGGWRDNKAGWNTGSATEQCVSSKTNKACTQKALPLFRAVNKKVARSFHKLANAVNWGGSKKGCRFRVFSTRLVLSLKAWCCKQEQKLLVGKAYVMTPAEEELCSVISKPQLQPQASGVNIPTIRHFVSTWPNASKWFEKVLNTKFSKNVFPQKGNKSQDCILWIYMSISSAGKESACNAGDQGSIPGLGRSPGEGNGNPFQYSFLENPKDRGA